MNITFNVVEADLLALGVGITASIEAVRDLLRRITGVSGEVIDYVSMKPLPGIAQPNMANVFLDGYVITFTTANDIPAITNQAPE
jgi:transketolase C-terminal domain/subunit